MHNPSAAPLFGGFRQTENAAVVKFGTGVWKSVTGLGTVQRRCLDSLSGQAAYFGIVEEGADSRTYALCKPGDEDEVVGLGGYLRNM
jgi:hypothetical protein